MMALAELGLNPFSPVTNAEASAIIPPIPRKIDIPRNTTSYDPEKLRSARYEDQVVDYVLSVTPTEYFILGPTLLERAFSGIRNLTVPDYIGAQSTNDKLLIKEIGEVKLGPRYFARDKVQGFTDLVQRYRENPDLFNQELEDILGFDLPQIIFPDLDQDIEFHFIAPRRIHSEHPIQPLETDFTVFYWPLSEAA